jgi:hypothetical protein
MKSFSQSFSGSQDRLMAQENSILKVVTSISSPKCELGMIKYDCPTYIISQSKSSTWQKENKGK